MIIGSAEIELRPDTNRFAADARKSLKGIGGDLGEAGAGLSGLTAKISAVGPAIAASVAAASAAASGLVSVVGALGPALAAAGVAGAGAMLALKQGVLVAKFAFGGLSEALAGNKDAIAALSPPAKKLVDQLTALKPRIEGIRTAAQRGLFPGVADAINTLASRYFPLLRTAARQTGDALGDVAAAGADMAKTPAFRSDFSTIAKGNADNLRLFGTAGLFLVNALRSVLVVAQPLIRTFAEFAVNAAASLDVAVQAGRASGALGAFFTRASTAASALGGTFKDLGVAIFNVFKIGAQTTGTGFLDTLQKGAKAARDFTESLAGQTAIKTFFENGRQNLQALGRLASGIIDIFHTLSGAGTPLAPLLDRVSAKLLPALGTLVQNASASKALEALVDALTDVINTLAQMEATDSSLKAFATTLGFLARAASAILTNVPGASKALGAFFIVAGGAKALSLVGLGGAVRALGSALLGLAATAASAAVSYAASMLGITAATEASTARTLVLIAKDIAARAASAAESAAIAALYAGSWIAAQATTAAAFVASTATQLASLAVRTAAIVAQGAIAIASFIAEAAAATAAGIATAAAFLLPLAPIILLGAAVVAIVVLIVKHWDKIKAATVAAFNAVKNAIVSAITAVIGFVSAHWPLIVALLAGPLGLAVLAVVKNWDKIKTTVSEGIATVITYIKSIPGKITSALGNVKGLLLGIGGDIVSGLVHGIENAGHLVIDAAKHLADLLPGWVRKVLGIGSPSKVMRELGFNSGSSYALGLDDAGEKVKQSTIKLVKPDMPALVAASQTMSKASAGGGSRLNIEQVVLPPASTPDAGQQLADGVRLLDAIYS